MDIYVYLMSPLLTFPLSFYVLFLTCARYEMWIVNIVMVLVCSTK